MTNMVRIRRPAKMMVIGQYKTKCLVFLCFLLLRGLNMYTAFYDLESRSPRDPSEELNSNDLESRSPRNPSEELNSNDLESRSPRNPSEELNLNDLESRSPRDPSEKLNLNGSVAAPKLIFTSCCWCPHDKPCSSSMLLEEIDTLSARGIDSTWLQMPCSSNEGMHRWDGGPNVTSEDFSTYSNYLRNAVQQWGSIVIPAQDDRINNEFCTPVEVSNKLAAYALSNGNWTLVHQKMALQNKRNLHHLFSKAGMESHTPRFYKNKWNALKKRRVKFPIMVKHVTGMASVGVTIVHSHSELEKVMKNRTIKGTIFEEAIIGDKAYVTHYMRRHTSPNIVSFFCGVYRKPEWQQKEKGGLFVQSRLDKPPSLEQLPCNREDTDAMTKILKMQEVYGVGCVDGKIDGSDNGVMKIFDWNVRQCASANPEILASLYSDLVLMK